LRGSTKLVLPTEKKKQYGGARDRTPLTHHQPPLPESQSNPGTGDISTQKSDT
jgi:hypothetical protein